MKKSIIVASLFAALAGQASAAPAVYQDELLTISEAVVVRDSGSTYFKDVRFEPNANGTWTFLGGSQRPLVAIEEVTVLTDAGDPPVAEVTVEGYKSVPCVELEPLAMSRSGDTFYVVIAETVQGPAESCIAVIDPFTLNFELDTFGLESGEYKLNVNGKVTEFDLVVP